MPEQTKRRRVTLARKFAEIENISIAGITERMGPIGLHVYAEAFLSSARALPTPAVPFEPVRPYLVCHAIELGLKAFLSLQGSAMLELAESKYGHNLEALFHCASEKGIANLVALTDAQSDAIFSASNYYLGKLFEYPAVGEALRAYPQLPPLDLLFEAATTLVESLRQPCREAK